MRVSPDSSSSSATSSVTENACVLAVMSCAAACGTNGDAKNNAAAADAKSLFICLNSVRLKNKSYSVLQIRCEVQFLVQISEARPDSQFVEPVGEEHPADMNMQVGLNAYQEISFSIRQKLKEKFTWGIRPKLLFGVANVRVSDLGVQVMTDEDDYTLRMNGNLSANVATSLPLLLSLDKTGMLCQFDWENLVVSDFFKNVGAAVDLGFRYEILKGLSVSASVMDLGGIFWKTSPKLIQGGLTDNGRYFDNGGILNGHTLGNKLCGKTAGILDCDGRTDGGQIHKLRTFFKGYYGAVVTCDGEGCIVIGGYNARKCVAVSSGCGHKAERKQNGQQKCNQFFHGCSPLFE